jgi:hypothetical protein
MVPSSGSISGFRTSSLSPSRKRLDIPAANADYRILDLELDRFAIDDELSVPVMMDGSRVLLRWVDPGFQHLKNE